MEDFTVDLKKLKLTGLVSLWEVLDKQETTSNNILVKGWILKELTKRKPQKMEKFVSGEYGTDNLRDCILKFSIEELNNMLGEDI